jgi:hypothetical protein
VRSVILDTNVLLLWLVGQLEPSKIGAHRRLSEFSLQDLSNLNKLLEEFHYHLTLPQILTETSNLIGAGSQVICRGATEALALYCNRIVEHYRPSTEVVSSPVYLRLGLTDCAITMAAERGATVVTIDHGLYGQLLKDGLGAINLLHNRTPVRFR